MDFTNTGNNWENVHKAKQVTRVNFMGEGEGMYDTSCHSSPESAIDVLFLAP
jgi:hypothetical protein